MSPDAQPSGLVQGTLHMLILKTSPYCSRQSAFTVCFSYSVAQRTQEIGVRMAIGAERGQIMRLALGDGLSWALSGIAIGLVAAVALSRVLGTLLFEVRAHDPITYVAVGGMLAAVATIACCIPAARATRIDPVVALRAE